MLTYTLPRLLQECFPNSANTNPAPPTAPGVPVAARATPRAGDRQTNELLHRQLECEITALQLLCRSGACPAATATARPRGPGTHPGTGGRGGGKDTLGRRPGGRITESIAAVPSQPLHPSRASGAQVSLEPGPCRAACAAAAGHCLP